MLLPSDYGAERYAGDVCVFMQSAGLYPVQKFVRLSVFSRMMAYLISGRFGKGRRLLLFSACRFGHIRAGGIV
jgi:hypothetical protein